VFQDKARWCREVLCASMRACHTFSKVSALL
jgi:hypothetical protein